MKPREERRPASFHGWFARDTYEAAWDFVITNLSYSGCRIKTAVPVKVGERLRLCVAGRGIIESTVVWLRGKDVELAFAVEPSAPAY